MSQNSRTGTSSVPVSTNIEKRLHTYAIAAGAAGVGLLALAAPANADIIYTKTNVTIGPNGSIGLDLNRDSVPDFAITAGTARFSSYTIFHLAARANGNNLVAGKSTSLLVRYRGGQQIGSKLIDAVSSGLLITGSGTPGGGSSQLRGAWLFGATGYLGLDLVQADGNHFGWARVTTAFLGGVSYDTTVSGFAYNTVPNQPIFAGQTPIPEPGTLGFLAVGAAALALWRRKKLA